MGIFNDYSEEQILSLQKELKEAETKYRHEFDRGQNLEKDKVSLNIKIRELEAAINTYDLIMTKILNHRNY